LFYNQLLRNRSVSLWSVKNMLQTKFTIATASLLMLASVSTAQAAPVVYFGENQVANGAVVGPPVTARNAFLARLTATVQSEGFESFSNGQLPPLDLVFTGSGGTLAATITGPGAVYDTPFGGRFNTTSPGAKFWETPFRFDIDFAAPISAFGFYGTDIGDFQGSVTVTLTDTAAKTTTLTIGHTVNGSTIGSLLFWGFVDESTAYTKISFGNTASDRCVANIFDCDAFGFDDMVIGDQRQIITTPPPVGVPVPGTLALAGLALAALGALRRKA
jgi:hypothetical protein